MRQQEALCHNARGQQRVGGKTGEIHGLNPQWEHTKISHKNVRRLEKLSWKAQHLHTRLLFPQMIKRSIFAWKIIIIIP